MPYIAYVRFSKNETEINRGVKPLELYDLMFIKKFDHVRMIQSYIYSSGDELLNPTHSTILAEYKLVIKKEEGALKEP